MGFAIFTHTPIREMARMRLHTEGQDGWGTHTGRRGGGWDRTWAAEGLGGLTLMPCFLSAFICVYLWLLFEWFLSIFDLF